MRKRKSNPNPTVGELQVFSGKFMCALGLVVTIFKIIKSIINKNISNEWLYIIGLFVVIEFLGYGMYCIGKNQIDESKKRVKKLLYY